MFQRICDTFGITMAQLFADEGEKPDLTPEQEIILLRSFLRKISGLRLALTVRKGADGYLLTFV